MSRGRPGAATAVLLGLMLVGAGCSGGATPAPAGASPTATVYVGPEAALPPEWPADFPMPATYEVATGVATDGLVSAILVVEEDYEVLVAFFDDALAGTPYAPVGREEGNLGTRWSLPDGGLLEVFDDLPLEVGIQLPRD